MSNTNEGTETLTIETLDFNDEYEVEFLLTKPPPGKTKPTEPVKLKRLVCKLNGCNYSTDRRRDLKRHRRSQKHVWQELCSEDSDSDFERSLFSCAVCEYTTAKRYSYERHKESRRHLMKEMDECEKLMEEADKSERPEKDPCETHNKSQEHQEILTSQLDANGYIDYIPQEKEHFVEPSEEFNDTDEDCETYLEDFSQFNSTLECKPCQYRTARRFCFVRHLQSMRHLARIQEEFDALEVRNALKQERLEAKKTLEEAPCFEESYNVEGSNGAVAEDDAEEIDGTVEANGLAHIDTLNERTEIEEIDGLVLENVVEEIEVLEDGVVQAEPGFHVIQYASVEENVYEEIVYLPVDVSPEESCYFIALNNE
ncbi:uncharacterized protein LOC108101032 [Drosophila ficusphila]|uniref:uncharacterized protein LOC108101032 n=1 Tax=Drosophila ficusphila TaxID=30025 RepID=UPI0007E6406B|nr:uncharacterized protein LOC108101032 [Drosophila ficusphila]